MSKSKDHNALVGRVKKAVKKTRRKLSEEQFDKELQRTISFLSELKDHIQHLQPKGKTPKGNGVKEVAPKAAPDKSKKKEVTKVEPIPAIATAKPAKSSARAQAVKK